MSKALARSYSALTSFETCPRRYYLTRVSKTVVEPPTEAITWGNCVHEALEKRAKDGTPMPTGMEHWAPLVDKIVRKRDDVGGELLVERQLALTADLKQTGWFDRDVWIRGVVDVGLVSADRRTVLALDYKTGKPKPDSDQLKLFAAMLMAVYAEAERVVTGFLWLKDNSTTQETYTRDRFGALWAEFMPRFERLQQAWDTNDWPPRPSGLCRAWCPCRECEYNGKR